MDALRPLLRLRWTPALATFLLALAVLVPAALAEREQHGDEKQYGWAAGYYAGRVAHLDFAHGPGTFRDPGWDPGNYWSSGSNFSSVFIYSAALAIAREPAPSVPYSFTDPRLQGPETSLAPKSLRAVRLAAAFCAALGLALLALRLRWLGLLAALVFLLLPNVRGDVTRAWAEGPLLVGYGLAALAFGTPWLGAAVGAATSFKLTALGLWPLLLLRRTQGGYSRLKGLFCAAAAWAILTPPSWWAFGPLDLVHAVAFRKQQFVGQSASAAAEVHSGFFLPTRYLLPLELLTALAVSAAVVLLIRRTAAALATRRESLSAVDLATPDDGGVARHEHSPAHAAPLTELRFSTVMRRHEQP